MFGLTIRCGLQSLAQATQHLNNPIGWDKILQKLKIIGGNDGKCVAELKLELEHINLHGGIHGGVTASIINNMCNYALATKALCRPGASLDMHVLYMNAPKEGEHLIITADASCIDDKTAFVECEIRTKAGNMLVAKGSQTQYVHFT